VPEPAADLATGADREPLWFDEVLAAGRRTERWIDLFGARAGEREPGLDRWVERMEHLVVEPDERGGMTAQAKAAIDRSLDALAAKGGGDAVPAEERGGDAAPPKP